MSDQPFFSVVVPVYNKEEHVLAAIDSVVKQSFKNFELIIVCDPSTDNSNALLREIVDSRIRMLYRDTPGPGGYAARNLGVDAARSEWIAFLDADDEWLSTHLASAFKMISSNPNVSFLFLNSKRVRDGRYKTRFLIPEIRKLNKIEMLSLFSEADVIHTNAIVARREDLVGSGGFPAGRSRRGGDSDLWLRLILRASTVLMSPEVTSIYRRDNSDVLGDVKNTSSVHPIMKTITEHMQRKNCTDEEIFYLKKLANRKSFSWAITRKMGGVFSLKELFIFFPTAFSISCWVRFVLLLLPSFVLNYVRMRRQNLLR